MRNLKKANALIGDIARENKFITPITPKDFPLFQKFFAKEPHTYGNSWTYVTQGMYGIGPKNLGYKYYDGKNLSAVAIYPKIEQPNLNVFYWVRPMGPTILDKIREISSSLLSQKSIPTYAKKLFKNQFDYLAAYGFKDTKNFPWHSSCPSEDDTHPEQIFDVKKTLTLAETLPRKKHLRKSTIRASKLKTNNRIVTSDKYFKRDAWRISKQFFSSDISKKKTIISDQYDYYNMIFSNIERSSLTKNIVYVNDRPLGYYLLEKQDNDYSSLYALIILRERLKFLTDFLLLYILQKLTTPHLNMGGSEDQGIYDFKIKYFPIQELKMYWATNFVS